MGIEKLTEFFLVIEVCRQIRSVVLRCSRIGNGIGIHLRCKGQSLASFAAANDVPLQIIAVKNDIGIAEARKRLAVRVPVLVISAALNNAVSGHYLS